jgi:hypothetical protein
MSALSKVLRDTEDNGLMFWCPGCETAHRIQHGAGSGPRWTWNGNAEKPTFSPSILTKFTQLTAKGKAELKAWRESGCPKGVGAFDSINVVCHSFVTDGNIQFLGDCTHRLAGQTAPLPDFP